ncbi:MAG: hypothetical protein C0483_23715 [Pirellula sp.]|nr:hypothetical protein [Pirellula sp.]
MPQIAPGAPSEQYLSREQFAALAGISQATLGRYLAAGRVPFFQPGGPRHRMTIPRSALETLTVPAKSRASVAKPQSVDGDKPANSSRTARPGPKPKWLRNT